MRKRLITSNRELRRSWEDPVETTLIQRKILGRKRLLLDWYERLYGFVCSNLATGIQNVEIGAGSSFLYKQIPGLIKSNVLTVQGNDLTFDAYAMPFEDGSMDNIILIDVLHHMEKPESFFEEAFRVIRRRGRILLNDPYMSILSFMVWMHLHPEDCNMSKPGFDPAHAGDPLKDANSASATLLFSRDRFEKINPGFRMVNSFYHSKFEYWLAGGYNFPQLFPASLRFFIPIIERAFSPLDKYLASFMFVVLEKP